MFSFPILADIPNSIIAMITVLQRTWNSLPDTPSIKYYQFQLVGRGEQKLTIELVSFDSKDA